MPSYNIGWHNINQKRQNINENWYNCMSVKSVKQVNEKNQNYMKYWKENLLFEKLDRKFKMTRKIEEMKLRQNPKAQQKF